MHTSTTHMGMDGTSTHVCGCYYSTTNSTGIQSTKGFQCIKELFVPRSGMETVVSSSVVTYSQPDIDHVQIFLYGITGSAHHPSYKRENRCCLLTS